MRNRVPFVLSAITFVIGAAGCAASREPASSGSAPMAVTAAPVAETEWPAYFEAGGVLQARATATIASRVLAPVTAVTVRPGDRVKRGQTLIELDGASLAEGAARADASAGAAAEGAAAAAAEVDRAEAALVLATATHRRIAELAASRAATAQELDEAVAAVAAARSSAAIARARQREAAAMLDAANGSRRAARAEAAYARLTAPFDGVVASRAVDPGSMASPGAALLVIEASGTLQLNVRLDAARAGAVTVGQRVAVRVDADSATAESIDGRVDEIARIDTDTHSFAVKVSLPTHGAWRSGLFGRARFAGSARRALAVPAAAVVRRGQLTFVYVAAGNRAELRAVSLGDSTGDRSEVLDGLTAGERVLIDPPARLADGAAITVTGGGAR